MKIERPKSLTELVIDQLRNAIIDGTFDMGDALSEVSISKRFEVSRTPVREAFARLELEGLVKTQPQKGTFVTAFNKREFRDICDVRVCLETNALRKALTRNDKAFSEALQRVVTDMESAHRQNDTARYLSLDSQFHQTFFDYADNRFLNEAYQTIASKMAVLRNRLGTHPDHLKKSFGEHCVLAEYAELNKIDQAIELLIAHIGRKEGSYWNVSDG